MSSVANRGRRSGRAGRAGRADIRGGQHTLGVCQSWVRFCRVFDDRQRAVAAPSCNGRRVSDVLANDNGLAGLVVLLPFSWRITYTSREVRQTRVPCVAQKWDRRF